MATITQ